MILILHRLLRKIIWFVRRPTYDYVSETWMKERRRYHEDDELA